MRVYGHLGELVQGRMGANGPVALITLPTPDLFVQVYRASGSFALHEPDGPAIGVQRVLALFRMLGVRVSGKWTVRLHMPVGEGAGASTAALLVFARAIAPHMTTSELIRAAIGIEGASDPLLLSDAHRFVWASRQGRVIARLPRPARVRVIGGFFGPKHPTDPTDNRFPDISDIIAKWPSACTDPHLLGEMVTCSTRRTMALRGGDFDMIKALQTRFGAWGAAIAHTGSGAAFLVSPARDPASEIAVLREAGWRYVHSYILG